jgi:AraC-like DNA-binding protein
MESTLFSFVQRYADTHAGHDNVARTSISGLSLLRSTITGELQHAINRPLIAIVVQGVKRVTTGTQTVEFGSGDSMVISADVPTISQITRASAGEPYYSIVVELDLALIERLVVEMRMMEAPSTTPLRVDTTEAEVADAALRLLRLLERPMAVPILESQLVRELHYWLLTGKLGSSIRNLGVANSHAQRIGRAISLIRESFSQPLGIERLAEAAAMSMSSFHQHFRAITSVSPLQFQKQLRLIEARRLMLSDGVTASNAAYAVGYESVPQFTREYGRMFGAPPVQDIRQARDRLQAAA